MYVRQFGYTIVPGQEEKAIALCGMFVEALRERGIAVQMLVGGRSNATLQLVEEYTSREAMQAARTALDCDEAYRTAVSRMGCPVLPARPVRRAGPAAARPAGGVRRLAGYEALIASATVSETIMIPPSPNRSTSCAATCGMWPRRRSSNGALRR